METYDELEARARRRIPRILFDFVAGGADDEVTLRRNRAAFDDIALVPRVLRGIDEVSTTTELFGQRIELPVLVAPAGAGGVAGPGVFDRAIRGAAAAGTITALGGMVTSEAALADSPPQWAQVYLTRDPEHVTRTVDAARARGCSALILTVSAPVAGNRERDKRNGLAVPIRIGRIDALRHRRWRRDYRANGGGSDATVAGIRQGIAARADADTGPEAHGDFIRRLFYTEQSWDDLRRLRDAWDGPLVVKGIMAPEDAVIAVDAGCEAVIVSNHGGRQLDSALAPIEMLPEVVAAVGDRAIVLMDGGVRRGTDVLKALALGAKAVLVGRPWIFAAALDGQAGVTRVLDQLRAELITTMHLLGVREAADLTPSHVRRRPGAAWS